MNTQTDTTAGTTQMERQTTHPGKDTIGGRTHAKGQLKGMDDSRARPKTVAKRDATQYS